MNIHTKTLDGMLRKEMKDFTDCSGHMNLEINYTHVLRGNCILPYI